MPLIDMAEAVSRGDIIVDEIDALNAVNSGKLSEIETARFSPLVIEHSRRQSSGNAVIHADLMQDLDDIEIGGPNGAVGSDDEQTWNNVLVDEVDFVHAVERGRINRNDLHIMGCRSNDDTWISRHVVGDVEEFGDILQNENDWNRVLVDEVDILHAVEHGSRIVNRIEYRLNYLHQAENGTGRSERNSNVVLESESTVNGVSSFEIGRTISADRPSRDKQ